MGHGDKLKDWDNRLDNTVQVFNEIFNDCKLDYPLGHEVTIGELLHSGHVPLRRISVNGVDIDHRFGYLSEIDLERYDGQNHDHKRKIKLGMR